MEENKRFTELIDYLKECGLISSYVELANMLGTNKASINDIKQGRKKLSIEIIRGMIFSYPQVNIDWLFTGEGDMLKEDEPEFVNNVHVYKDIPKDKHPDFRLVPLINLDAVGGNMNDMTDIQQAVDGYIPFLEAKTDDICLPVSGRSMLPTFGAGSVVLAHPIQEWWLFLELGNIYVLDLNDGRRLIKEIRRSEENPKEYFRLVSHNPEFDPVELPKNKIRSIWIVKAMYQKMTM